jgi:hypothetical protein
MNSILILQPYRHAGTWVFDDAKTGLVQEPFLEGIPEMIDELVRAIEGAARGFRLLFSPAPFPGWQAKLEWRREEYGGNWYFSPTYEREGWLCPALFKYFDTAPREIYVKAEALTS